MEPLDTEMTSVGTRPIVVTIIGSRGYGKTTLMQALQPDLGPNDRARIVSPVDVLHKRTGLEYTPCFGSDPNKAQKIFGGIMSNGRFEVIYMDEFDEYCVGAASSRNGGYCCDALYRLVNYARNDPWRKGVVCSARGSADVTTGLLRSSDLVFLGRTTEPNAIEYVRKWMQVPEIDMETVIRNVPKHVFVVWAPLADFPFKGFVETTPEGGIEEWTPDDEELKQDQETEEKTSEEDLESPGPGSPTSSGTTTPSPSPDAGTVTRPTRKGRP